MKKKTPSASDDSPNFERASHRHTTLELKHVRQVKGKKEEFEREGLQLPDRASQLESRMRFAISEPVRARGSGEEEESVRYKSRDGRVSLSSVTK